MEKSVPWTWLSSYEKFCSVDLVVVLWKSLFHGLGCRPMENFVPWTWLSSYGKVCSMDLVVVLWKILFRGLGCRPMEKFFLLVTIDLVVVLWMHVCTCAFFLL
jgi:hypothetical protein